MNLKEISKKDHLWRRYALKLSGDKFLADDLVQEMYLRVFKIEKEINDFYIILLIKSIFFDKKKKKEIVVYLEDYDFLLGVEDDSEDKFEVNDEQKKILENYKKLPFHQKQLLKESYSKSLRQIQKQFNINYVFAHREIKKAKKTLLK